MEEPCSNGPTYWIWRRFRISGCLGQAHCWHRTNHSQCVKDCLLWNVVEEVLLDPAALQNGCEGVLPLAMDSVSCSAARPPAPSRADVMRSNSMALRCLKRRWSSAFSMGDCAMLHSVTTDSAADSWKTSKWACSTGSDKTNVTTDAGCAEAMSHLPSISHSTSHCAPRDKPPQSWRVYILCSFLCSVGALESDHDGQRLAQKGDLRLPPCYIPANGNVPYAVTWPLEVVVTWPHWRAGESADPCLSQGRGGAWYHQRCGTCFFTAMALPCPRPFHSGATPVTAFCFSERLSNLVGSPLPSLGTWFHIFHLILSWNLSPRYFKLEGNEMLLILALADICPKSMHTTHTEIPHMHTTHMYTWWTSMSHPLRSCNRLNNHKSRTKIFTNVYAITKKEWNSTYCIQIQEKCLYLWKKCKKSQKT